MCVFIIAIIFVSHACQWITCQVANQVIRDPSSCHLLAAWNPPLTPLEMRGERSPAENFRDRTRSETTHKAKYIQLARGTWHQVICASYQTVNFYNIIVIHWKIHLFTITLVFYLPEKVKFSNFHNILFSYVPVQHLIHTPARWA